MTALGDDATVPKMNVTSDVTLVGKGLIRYRGSRRTHSHKRQAPPPCCRVLRWNM